MRINLIENEFLRCFMQVKDFDSEKSWISLDPYNNGDYCTVTV